MSAAAQAKLQANEIWSPPPERKKQQEKGFTQFPNASLVHLGRICSAGAEQLCIFFLARHTLSAIRPAGERAPEWSKLLTSEDFAWWAFESEQKTPITVKEHLANVRLIQHSLERLAEDRIIERVQKEKGRWSYRICFDRWADLPDYARKMPAASAESLDSAEEDEPSTEAAAPQWKGRFVSNGTRQEAVALTFRPDRYKPPRCQNGEIEVSAKVLRNGTLEQEVRILSFGEYKANERNLFRQENTDRVENTKQVQNGGWNGFFLAVADAKLSFSRVDLEEAERIFKRLPIEDQLAATQGIRERLKAGEFQDPRFRPRPDNYLAKRAWERPVRPQKNGGSADLVDEVRKRFEELKR